MKINNSLTLLLSLLLIPAANAADTVLDDSKVTNTIKFNLPVRCSMEPQAIDFNITNRDWHSIEVQKTVKVECENIPAGSTINLISEDKTTSSNKISNYGGLLSKYVNNPNIAISNYPISLITLNLKGNDYQLFSFISPKDGVLSAGEGVIGSAKVNELVEKREILFPVNFIISTGTLSEGSEIFDHVFTIDANKLASFGAKLKLSIT